MRRRHGGWLWVAVLVACTAGAAAAQEEEGGAARGRAASSASGPVVASLEVSGAAGADSERVAAAFGLGPGTQTSGSSVRDALRRVWDLDLFEDLWLGAFETPAGLALVLHVEERPRLTRLEFSGNKKIKADDLRQHSGLVPGARLSDLKLVAAVDSLRRIYREKGYVRAAVVATTHPMAPGQAAVSFSIDEGKPARIGGFAFPGAVAYPSDRLRKELASKKKGFLKGGKLDPDKVVQDIAKLRAFYRENGYKDVEVTRDSLQFSPDGQRMTLVYRIAEGPRFRLGEVRWQGNRALGDAKVRALSQLTPGGWYNGTAIERTTGDTYSEYAEQGYLYVNVEPVEQVDDSGLVDVTFQVQEGAPSHVRNISITGNTRTKEKVVRRELAVRPGDLFRRSLIIRSRDDVFRLGFFQDVQPDFRPADSTDVDLIFSVVEKETGTASAGAGYSSEGGLTGFISLGHNNLFGNGQSINIQLERGARRSNYDISFTDPWFRDSRTTLGFSLFRRDRETEVVGTGSSLRYRDKRTGGSIRFGRPLGFVDYTRGYLTYRLEGVNFEVVPDDTNGVEIPLTPAQGELRKLIESGERTTSAVELSLRRDNTRNPFYPEGGARLNWSSEFAGSFLGGQVRYHKHEFDGRWYFPSLVKPVTTMIRYRVGAIGNYGKDVPAYERFRLGGTTFYGLRGYEDYEIVPTENIRQIPDTTDKAAPYDSVHFTEIRYPGGRLMQVLTLEQQFLIVKPVHGLLFFDAGGTWNEFRQVQLGDIRKGVGLGVRLEVPLLGNLGLDFGYGFDRRKPGWRTHFLLGNLFF